MHAELRKQMFVGRIKAAENEVSRNLLNSSSRTAFFPTLPASYEDPQRPTPVALRKSRGGFCDRLAGKVGRGPPVVAKAFLQPTEALG